MGADLGCIGSIGHSSTNLGPWWPLRGLITHVWFQLGPIGPCIVIHICACNASCFSGDTSRTCKLKGKGRNCDGQHLRIKTFVTFGISVGNIIQASPTGRGFGDFELCIRLSVCLYLTLSLCTYKIVHIYSLECIYGPKCVRFPYI